MAFAVECWDCGPVNRAIVRREKYCKDWHAIEGVECCKEWGWRYDKVGRVCMGENIHRIVIGGRLDDGWRLTDLRLSIVTNPDDFPRYDNGAPKPIDYEYEWHYGETGVKRFLETVEPKPEWTPGKKLYYAYFFKLRRGSKTYKASVRGTRFVKYSGVPVWWMYLDRVLCAKWLW